MQCIPNAILIAPMIFVENNEIVNDKKAFSSHFLADWVEKKAFSSCLLFTI